jgi:hypothetical protein
VLYFEPPRYVTKSLKAQTRSLIDFAPLKKELHAEEFLPMPACRP